MENSGKKPIIPTGKTPGQNPVRKRRKDARPGEIIEAGLREFANRGYAATRLTDIAKRAGITKGTIYRYFDDKQALFLAAVQSHASPTINSLDHTIEKFEGSTRQLLTALINIVHQNLVQGDLQILVRIILSEGRNFPELTELYYEEGVGKAHHMLEKIVQRGITRGEIRAGAAADLPLVIMAPAILAIVWQSTFSQQHPIDAQKFLDAHIDLILNGILVSDGD